MSVRLELLANLPVVDMEVIASLKEIMEEDFVDLLETFLSDATIRMQSIERATIPIEPESLRKAAHSFKGSCGNIGVRRLSELCRQLEDTAATGVCPDALVYLEQIRQEYAQAVVAIEKLLAG